MTLLQLVFILFLNIQHSHIDPTALYIHTGKSQEKSGKSTDNSKNSTTAVQGKTGAKKKSSKKATNNQESETKADSTAQQGLTVLKNLIAKAAAGTLGTKNSSTKISTETTTTDELKITPKSSPLLSDQPKLAQKSTMEVQTESIGVSTETTNKDDAVGQENDYWLEEKLKMQNAPAYQSFQKGAQLKKNLTSKSTSPPPQTISTQVFH